MEAQVAVLIPTLNEEATIGRVIDRIPVHALSNDGYDTTSYVIDGDSEDRTQQKALEKGAVVFPTPSANVRRRPRLTFERPYRERSYDTNKPVWQSCAHGRSVRAFQKRDNRLVYRILGLPQARH